MREVSLATPADAEAITHIQEESWLATYPNGEAGIRRDDIVNLRLASPEQVERWRRSLETEKADRRVWVVRESGIAIGYCVARMGDEVNRIQAIYVSPQHQGRGHGAALMQAALSWLGREKDIVLDVAMYNAPSIGFYEKLGFVRTGTTSAFPVPGTDWTVPVLEMCLKRVGEV